MQEETFRFLPERNGNPDRIQPMLNTWEPNAPCPCCGERTIPNSGDAPAFICPHCFWEIDPFIQTEDEPSDQNHGLTLRHARENYEKYGVCAEQLRHLPHVPPEIGRRRSIRRFFPSPIPPEKIGEILRAGMAAPSAKNRQPWKFIVVSGSAKEEMLAAMAQGLTREKNGPPFLPESREHLLGAEQTLDAMRDAPVTVFVLNTAGHSLLQSLTPEERIAEACNIQSIGAALENMALAAEGLGLGCLWIGDIFFAYEELTRWLDTEGELTAAMSFGYPAERPEKRPRKTFADTVEWRG